MTGETRRGAVLTDHELVRACSTGAINAAEAAGARVYTATYSRPAASPRAAEYIETRTFAVGHAEAAAIYAREYAARMLGDGWRVLSVRWQR